MPLLKILLTDTQKTYNTLFRAALFLIAKVPHTIECQMLSTGGETGLYSCMEHLRNGNEQTVAMVQRGECLIDILSDKSQTEMGTYATVPLTSSSNQKRNQDCGYLGLRVVLGRGPRGSFLEASHVLCPDLDAGH